MASWQCCRDGRVGSEARLSCEDGEPVCLYLACLLAYLIVHFWFDCSLIILLAVALVNFLVVNPLPSWLFDLLYTSYLAC